MDKKKDFKKGIDSHTFMDKLLTKFKMAKHGGEEKGSTTAAAGYSGSSNATNNNGGIGCGKKLKGSSSLTFSPKESVKLISWDNTKVTPENIMEFSNQLHEFLQYVQSLKDVVFYTYEYPNTLHDKLEKEATELQNLFQAIRASAIEIERLRKHRTIVRKEKCFATRKLDQLKDEEMTELESIICAFTRPLHSQWQAIKDTQKADVLENFMNEVKSKHKAIDVLLELVRRKLSKLSKKQTKPFTVKKNISSSNMNSKIKNQDKPTNWNIPPFPELDKFGQTIDKVVRTSNDRDAIRMCRRKRHKDLREERRRPNLDVNNFNSNNNAETSGGLDLQLVPIENFRNEEADDTVAVPKTTTSLAVTATSPSARTQPIVNIDYTSDDDSISLSSSEFMIESLVQSGSTELSSNLRQEMRTVLEALFGEIRHTPQIAGATTRNRLNNSGNDLRSSRTANH